MSNALGRRTPKDFKHVEKYPYSAVAPRTVQNVEKTLKLPSWHWSWDQGAEGACVGFGSQMMMSILNKKRYDPIWLWNQAKIVDEWPDTNPGDDNGTSVHAACDVLRVQGDVVAKTTNPVLSEGIETNRWATSVDEVRTALSQGIPVAIGINWYENFDEPKKYKRCFLCKGEYYIGKGDLGSIRGGHCICIYGASDKRYAFKIKNSWGRSFPLCWLPYNTFARLLEEDGEATLVTDR